MADKFTKLMDMLQRIEMKLDRILEAEEDDIFGDDPYDEEDYVPLDRRSIVAKSNEGVEFRVNWDDLDPRMQQAIEISDRLREPYQVYEDPSGKLRIMVSNAVATDIHRRTTPQPKRGDR